MKKIGLLAVALLVIPSIASAATLFDVQKALDFTKNLLQAQIGYQESSVNTSVQVLAQAGDTGAHITIRTYNNCVFDDTEGDCSRFVGNVDITVVDQTNNEEVFSGETDSSGFIKIENLPTDRRYSVTAGKTGYEDRSGVETRTIAVGGVGQTTLYNIFFKNLDGDNTNSLRIISPNGGESIEAGDNITVSWEPSSPGIVVVDLLDENGNYEATLFSEKAQGNVTIPNTSGSLTVPTSASLVGEHKIRIYEYDASNYSVNNARGGRSDTSDSSFNIVLAGDDSSTDDENIDPSLSISVSPNFGVAPLTVTFEVDGKDLPTCSSSTWVFGDGNLETVTPGCIGEIVRADVNYTRDYTYDEPGTYVASLALGSELSNEVSVTVEEDGTYNDTLRNRASELYRLIDLALKEAQLNRRLNVANHLDEIDFEIDWILDQDEILEDEIALGLANDIRNEIDRAITLMNGGYYQSVSNPLSRALGSAERLVDRLGSNLPDNDDNNTPSQPGSSDINADGEVDVGDVLLILRETRGLVELSPAQVERGDHNGNGRLDSEDLIIALRRALGFSENFLMGDINQDGRIDVNDVVAVNRFVAGLDTPTGFQRLLADVNLDNELTQADVEILLDRAVGL